MNVFVKSEIQLNKKTIKVLTTYKWDCIISIEIEYRFTNDW